MGRLIGVGRAGSLGWVAACAIVLASGCQGSSASGGPELVEVKAPDQIEAVDVGDLDSQEPFDDTQLGGSTPDVTYVFADDLALPTQDFGYVYRAGGTVDPGMVSKLADYFGLDPAEVQNWDDFANAQPDESNLEPGQVAAAGLGYSPSEALQQWTYADYERSNPYLNCQPIEGQPSSVGEGSGTTPADGTLLDLRGGGDTPDLCIPPEPDGTPPTGPQAEQRLQDMLDQIGVSHGQLSFQTFADRYSAATNAVEIDESGVRTGREWSATYGADGAVITAMGPFAVPERVGPYTLVDLDTAKQRVESGVNSFGSMGPGTDSPATGSPATGSPATGSPATATPAPVDGEPTVVQIVSVDADLFWIWDAQDSAWLVPAYAFVDASGGVWSVPAVPDDLFRGS